MGDDAQALKPPSSPPTPEQLKEQYRSLLTTIVEERQRPLLVMYYPLHSSIADNQVEPLYSLLTKAGLQRSAPLPELDLLLHTFGGEPSAAYRLAQVVRNFTNTLTFLVPTNAFSAGTLMCLAGNEILLGDLAALSPIDITLVRPSWADDEGDGETYADEEAADTEVELVAIDYFIQVAKQARIEIERGFRQRRWKTSKTDVENSLLCEMTRQLGVLTIAKYYREKNITQAYAEELLRYMFGNGADPRTIARILRRLVVESPSHEFFMDYHICSDVGLKVAEMPESLSAATRELAKVLSRLVRQKDVFPVVRGIPLPLMQFVPYTADPDAESQLLVEPPTTEEARNGQGQPPPASEQQQGAEPIKVDGP